MSAIVLIAAATAGAATAQIVKDPASRVFRGGPTLLDESIGYSGSSDVGGGSIVMDGPVKLIAPMSGSAPTVGLSFEGISQYDVASVGRNFIPPDTMGAIGRSQFVETVNGGVAVFDKATGVRTSFVSDVAFWAAAGQTGTNGDPRVMYNADADRWIALSFGANLKDIQIAISDTSNALGTWKSTKYEGYAGLGFGAIADYPTLALDKNAVYISTNNFAPGFAGGGNAFRGTTLSVIPLASLFSGAAPTTAGIVKFDTPCCAPGFDPSHGFAIQGVNSSSSDTSGYILAASLVSDTLNFYKITDAGTLGATRTGSVNIGSGYDANGPARQPDVAGTGSARVVSTLDDRISGSVWEVGGRIYSVHTITEIGGDFTSVRWNVIDKATGLMLDEGAIGGGGFDYYMGSLAVNEFGQVVIAYNRSGSVAGIGKISFLAQAFTTDGTGKLVAQGSELLLHVSDVDDYHNGSGFGSPAAGRQRWGDYSAVTIDPLNHLSFWAIGQFAREYNNAASGHPGGTGGSRWGTWISQISVPGGAAVPEPATWAMMILGFGLIGATARRRRAVAS